LEYSEENLFACTDIIEVCIPVAAVLLEPVRFMNPIEVVPIPGELELKLLLISLTS
jgi:hypothetical protein